MNKKFWRKKKVLITGHTGFKGSWLSLWLQSAGAEVLGYALRPPTNPNLFELAGVASGMNSIVGDVRNFEALKEAVAEHKPEIILHLAAQTVVRSSYDNPIETYSTNVMGTVHLLEAVRQLKRKCVVIIITSDKCYKNHEWIWGYRENDELGGHDPYSNSKACAELVTSSFRDSFFQADSVKNHSVSVASVRAGNVIGGGDWTKDQLIPDLMRAFLAGQPCLIRSPSAVRPWQFVLEPLRGYLMLAERLVEDPNRFASGWNFGPAEADAKPVSWIADELARLWGDHASRSEDVGMHPPEDHYLKLDASKARTFLDWQPLLPLNQSLDWIVEWYRAFKAKDDIRHLTLSQIERYEALLNK